MYDVIIIGCGQAGLMAARELNKTDADFICLDIRKRVGEPLQCGEGIGKRDFVEIFGRFDYPFVLNEISEHRLIYNGKQRGFYEPYFQIDKPAFERWLAKPVMSRIRCGVLCKDIIVNNDCVDVITAKGDFRTKLVIIATGPNHDLQKKLGLTGSNPRLVACYGGIYNGFKLDEKKFYFI